MPPRARSPCTACRRTAVRRSTPRSSTDPPPPTAASGSVPGPGGDSLRRLLRDSVGGTEASGNIVIVHTPPGFAGMVASAVDRTGVDGIAGTLAGDDTILVVCRQGVPARTVELRLRQMAGLETKQLHTGGGKR